MVAVQERLQDQNQREVGSKAFSFEGERRYTHAEIYNDIVSYLGEYRFKLPRYDYQFVFSDGELRGLVCGESMMTKAQRAIEKNRMLGDSTIREEAELEGIKSLEDQLRFSQIGDAIFWASPPGSKEEGYGNYGFFYFGKVEERGHVSMTAIRVENPAIGDFNTAMSTLSGGDFNFQTVEEYLTNPTVLNYQLDTSFVDDVLWESFKFKPDPKEQERFKYLIMRMRPLIDELVGIIQTGSPREKIQAFHAVENYFIQLEKESRNATEVTLYSRNDPRLAQIIDCYNYQPPIVGGSCGGTGSKSNNLLESGSSLSFLLKDDLGEREFPCPVCGCINTRPFNQTIPRCQNPRCPDPTKVAC